MIELLLIGVVAIVFWQTAIKWWRFLSTRDLLEGLHPTAASVAKIEASTPQFGDPR
jgi:hypothetical protein